MDNKDRAFIVRLRGSLLAFAALLLASCQTTPVTGSAAPAAGALPPLPVQGTAHYVLDAARSDVRFLVYRAGPLGAFGHNHVIEAKRLEGDVYLADDIHASGFSMTLPVAGFTVDDAASRRMEGPDFASQPSAAAIEGTRKNMLGPSLLDGEHFPDVVIRSVKLLGPDWGLDATVRITLHGIARDMTVPIAVERSGASLEVTGTFDIEQSDFGITPFSILGGGLQVADRVRIRFHLVATKAP